MLLSNSSTTTKKESPIVLLKWEIKLKSYIPIRQYDNTHNLEFGKQIPIY